MAVRFQSLGRRACACNRRSVVSRAGSRDGSGRGIVWRLQSCRPSPDHLLQVRRSASSVDDYRMKGRTYKYFTGEPLFRLDWIELYELHVWQSRDPLFCFVRARMPLSLWRSEIPERRRGKVVQLYVRDLKASARTDSVTGGVSTDLSEAGREENGDVHSRAESALAHRRQVPASC